MSRPLSERVRDPVWWLEQGTHAWAGHLAAWICGGALAALWGPLAGAIGATAAGVVLGVVVEIAQNLGDEDNSVGDSIADALAYALGGVMGSDAFWVAWTHA